MCSLYARVVEMSPKKPRFPRSHHIITIKMPVWKWSNIRAKQRRDRGQSKKKKKSTNSCKLLKPVILYINSTPRLFSLWALLPPVLLIWVGFMSPATKVFWLICGGPVGTRYEVFRQSAVAKGQGESNEKFDLLIVFSRSWLMLNAICHWP